MGCSLCLGTCGILCLRFLYCIFTWWYFFILPSSYCEPPRVIFKPGSAKNQIKQINTALHSLFPSLLPQPVNLSIFGATRPITVNATQPCKVRETAIINGKSFNNEFVVLIAYESCSYCPGVKRLLWQIFQQKILRTRKGTSSPNMYKMITTNQMMLKTWTFFKKMYGRVSFCFLMFSLFILKPNFLSQSHTGTYITTLPNNSSPSQYSPMK